ncbi:MAG: hypothetical protein ABR955_13675 [Verrucomicrobiota bacterium]|jgi:hypothetical protein
MKSKQLANVLIKILGLSVCIHAVPAFITGIYQLVVYVTEPRGIIPGGGFWFYVAPNLFYIAVGIYLIVTSRKVVGFLFKNEDE